MRKVLPVFRSHGCNLWTHCQVTRVCSLTVGLTLFSSSAGAVNQYNNFHRGEFALNSTVLLMEP